MGRGAGQDDGAGPRPAAGQSSTKRPLFAEHYRPVRLPWTYRPAAAVVMLLALLQPLIYGGTIVLVGYGAAWWAMEGASVVGLGGGRVGGYRTGVYVLLFKLVLYAAPLIAAVCVLAVLVGSLVPSRSGPRVRAYPLARFEHPLIYLYVDKLCDIMHAPRPVRIEISPDANASAGFDHDPLWLVRRRLVLTVGATLVAGLSRRELTGVIAHELGHFTQGGGMRTTRIVGGINTWFLRVVYQRGMVDDLVEEMCDSDWAAVAVVGAIAAACVGIVRGLIKIVAAGSRLATVAFLRRMEVAADRCEARVAGSRAMVGAAARLEELSLGYQRAVEIARHEMNQGRLPENLSELAREIAPKFERDARGFIAGYRDEPSIWSTHPPTGERVRAAIELAEPGIVLSDGPATKLFPGFEETARHATRFAFERAADGALSGFRMMPTDEILGRGKFAPVAASAAVVPMQARKGEPTRAPVADGSDIIPFAE